MQDLKKLLIGELHDIYDAEQQLVKTLPLMADKAQSPSLQQAFRTHCDQTAGHIQRVEEALRLLGAPAKRRSCKAMEGIIDEGQLIAAEFKGNSALDAALISAAQKVEHYEITSYGCLASWAEELGASSVANLLRENLAEEKQTDRQLTSLAEAEVNRRGAMQDTPKRSTTAAKVMKSMGGG
jgi:ferritin-like metal-binding protein YciE